MRWGASNRLLPRPNPCPHVTGGDAGGEGEGAAAGGRGGEAAEDSEGEEGDRFYVIEEGSVIDSFHQDDIAPNRARIERIRTALGPA